MLLSLYRHAVISLVRPYVKRELPGWGHLYRILVGSFERDHIWQGEPERWVRGKLHGYLMSLRIDGWSNRQTFFLERFYDLPTQLLLKRALRAGDIFVDAGANEGMMTLLAASLVGEQGKVISFEPNPVPGGILRRNLRRNGIANVEFHAAGLAETAGEMPLFVPHINTGEGSFTAPTGDTNGEYTICPLLVGDEILRGRNPRLIKVDVEGFEAHVLKGLTQAIGRARPLIVMEMVARHLGRDGQTPETLCKWLAAKGYEGQRLDLEGRGELRLLPMGAEWRDGDYLFMHPSNPL